MVSQQSKNNTKIQEDITFGHTHKRETNIGGSPVPWAMSTKGSHIVTFIS